MCQFRKGLYKHLDFCFSFYFIHFLPTVKQNNSPCLKRPFSVDSCSWSSFSDSERERPDPKYNKQLAKDFSCCVKLATTAQTILFEKPLSASFFYSQPFVHCSAAGQSTIKCRRIINGHNAHPVHDLEDTDFH